ncbi:tryptophan synthase subunit alpha [Alteromonas aestuariivivens]|uniref:Tryptophan synthase alpha chain n=1 Tax=Alteromonas aestuariivivens TaxID=1938339 RepID=A0A3D8M3W9_9ALTE|nr:tryptophan synthase subunit alpha [Alteromonas aestuariivivens]RDV24280.1 tryptophan synthase subunit alpha [Alteromonas aestuariivivens]
MDRYQTLFARLDDSNEGAFVPFVMIGDPDLETSEAIIRRLIESGADALELGIPYSDPIADGPTIQAASIRALSNKVTPDACLQLLKRIRADYPDVPVGLLLYSNLVMVKGIDAFYVQAKDAGVDSILVADIPLREAKPFLSAATQTGINQILIAPPNATEEILAQIGEHSSGYTYLLGRAGVTGAETAADIPAADLIERLQQVQCAPPLLGFGISTPQQVKTAIEAGAAGAISGSATVNIIAANLDDKETMLKQLDEFVRAMKAATQKG